MCMGIVTWLHGHGVMLLIRVLVVGQARDAVGIHSRRRASCTGCLNGGGQLPALKDQSATAWQAEVEQAYHHPSVQPRSPQDDPLVGAMYKDWVQDQAKSLLHTAYHIREIPVSAQVSDW